MKKWLKEQEIIFKTIVYALLAIMAIFVSIQANNIAGKQVQIMQEQTRILSQQQLPIINLKLDSIFDTKAGIYADETLVISNEGAPLRDFSVYPAVFFVILYGKEGGAPRTMLIPVTDYFLATVHTGRSTAGIANLSGEHNRLLYFEAEKRFIEFTNAHNALGFTNLARYVEITYSDILGENHTEYYYIDPITGGSMLTGITRIAAIQAVKLHHEASLIGLSVNLSEATPETLLAKWEIAQQHTEDYPLLHFLFQ